MSIKNLIVVSEIFSEFAQHIGAVSPAQVMSMLQLPAILLPNAIVLHRGQGLPDSVVEDLVVSVLAADPNGDRWDATPLKLHPGRADPALSHKKKACNTLIASPIMVDDRTYTMDLCIDQNCELMDDHQTGQHVQGMVLIEASRQAFLAVTESFFLRERNQQSYFVINSIKSEFKNFVFPVSAHLLYRVLTADINDRRQKFEVEIDLIQSGNVCMTTFFSFTVYPATVIAQKECGLAEIAARAALSGAFPIHAAAPAISDHQIAVA